MTIFLTTKRLILRNLIQDDVNNLVELDSNPEVMRFINGGNATSPEAVINDFLPYAMSYYEQEKNLGFWAIVEKSSQNFIGWIFLRPETDFKLLQQLDLAEPDAIELGYRIRQSSWNQGYTTEAARALVETSFTRTKTKKITAWALTENQASIKVMKKVGMELQQEYFVTADLIPAELLENSLVQNLLERRIVRYQITSIPGKLSS